MPRKKDTQALSPAVSELTVPSPTLLSGPIATRKQWLRGDSVAAGMDLSPVSVTPSTSTVQGLGVTLTPDDPEDMLLASRHEVRQGRRYMRDVPYLLPSDLAEVHRESLRTLLMVTVFSRATCCPAVEARPPLKVLELGCGSAFWSSTCHDYFQRLGHSNVSFTGVDITSIVPDLAAQGVNWNFVQHDLRELPWPFADNEFDFIMIKDLSLAVPHTNLTTLLEESMRLLREEGSLEVWESDHVVRCLLPHDRLPPTGTSDLDEATANHTQTYLITPGMSFAPAQNDFFADTNGWVGQACNKHALPSTPCVAVAEALHREDDLLCNVGHRRVAIPFTELPWETEHPGTRKRSHASSSVNSFAGTKSSRTPSSNILLTPEQAAIRHTALMTVIQKIESLEPALNEFSGKNADEWATWWAGAMSNLLDQNGALTGECLEIGAWWATKRTRPRTSRTQ